MDEQQGTTATVDVPEKPQRSRRGLLKATAAAFGGIALGIFGRGAAVTNALASTGGYLVIGSGNLPTNLGDVTSLEDPSSTALMSGGLAALKNYSNTLVTLVSGQSPALFAYTTGSANANANTRAGVIAAVHNSTSNQSVHSINDDFGVLGDAAITGGWGVVGLTTTQAGVAGQNEGSGDANGVAGYAGFGTGGAGVFGYGDQAPGVVGSSGSNHGVHGTSTSSVGVYGHSSSNVGVQGDSGTSNGLYGTSASSVGTVGYSTSNTGVWGYTGSSTGYGVYGSTSAGTGVFGYTSNPSGGGLAGHFLGPTLVVGDFTVSGGAKSAAVPFPDGTQRRMYCMESPESWFEDFGTGSLKTGAGHVSLDAGFGNVVDPSRYHVFITAQGDSNGLYVTNQTPNGFDVKEQKGGTSSLDFSYRIVAKRKDIVAPRFEKVDLPAGPPPDKRGAPAGPVPGASQPSFTVNRPSQKG